MGKYFSILFFTFICFCKSSDKNSITYKSVSFKNKPELIDSVLEDNNFRLIGWHLMDSSITISTDSMIALTIKNGYFNGKIQGVIKESCEMSGCWISLNCNNINNKELKISFKDFFTIPTNYIKDDYVELFGKAIVDTISIEKQLADLEKKKKSGYEISQLQFDEIITDKIEISFEADAILLKKN